MPICVDKSISVTSGEHPDSAFIAAYSERQAMDWSLVLASQDIATTIIHPDAEHWGLLVSPGDYMRAIGAIRQFRLENRGWKWQHDLPWTGVTFHFGSLVWCFWLILIQQLSLGQLPQLRSTWIFDKIAVQHGEWWRAFTAIFLHADLAHLCANLATGFILFGLAMARYGAGPALLCSFLAGAIGNAAGFLIYPEPYKGLGASGMVMGALGLLAAQPLLDLRTRRLQITSMIRGMLAGALLFVLLGTDPTSDVAAHLGGFAGGVFIGTLLLFLPLPVRHSRLFAAGCWLVLATLLILTITMATGSPR